MNKRQREKRAKLARQWRLAHLMVRDMAKLAPCFKDNTPEQDHILWGLANYALAGAFWRKVLTWRKNRIGVSRRAQRLYYHEKIWSWIAMDPSFLLALDS